MYPKTLDADILVRNVGEEVLLFQTASHQLHYLNGTAAKVWTLCDGKHSTGQMVDALEQRFEMPRARLERDVATTLQALAQLGLIDPD